MTATETIVSYHRDDYGPARPAVNVKVHGWGGSFWPQGWPLATDTADDTRYRSDLIGVAQDRIYSDFWSDAAAYAEHLGLGPIEQEGRSGGWLVLTDGYDPQDHPDPEHVNEWPEAERSCSGCDERRQWLAAYRQLAEWCAEQVAAAPVRVAALAQQLAMDELGAEPARRMFGTFQRRWVNDPCSGLGTIEWWADDLSRREGVPV